MSGFQRGSQAGPQPPPPLPFFLFCYATSKTFWMAFRWRADGCPTMCAGWDRVCPCLVPSSSSVALIRFLRFCKILVRKMQQNIPCDALSCMDPEILSDEVQLNSDTLFFRWMDWGIKIPLKAGHRQPNSKTLAGRWLPNMECWLGSFWFSRGSGPVLLKSPKGFRFSRVGVRTLCRPLSGSAHLTLSWMRSYRVTWAFEFLASPASLCCALEWNILIIA